GVLNEILAVPALAERVQAGLGVDPPAFLSRLRDSGTLVADVAQSLSEAVTTTAPPTDGGSGITVAVDPGSEVEGQLGRLLTHARDLHESGRVQLSQSALQEVTAAVAQGTHRVSLETLQAVNEAVAAAGEPGDSPVELAASHLRIVVSAETRERV